MAQTLALAGRHTCERTREVNTEPGWELVDSGGPASLIADNVYYSNDNLVGLQQVQVRSYVRGCDVSPSHYPAEVA
jgi:hypothetical protein